MNSVQKSQQITEQLITILMGIIPTYEGGFWSAETELFGAIAEFDSMAIVTIIGEIEEQFDVTFEDDDISAENFASISSLTDLVFEYLK